MEIKVGMRGTATTTVTTQNTAKAVGSGSLEVFATPMLLALMEQAAVECIAPAIPEEQTSVGTMVQLTHTAATPLGRTVTATATVTAVDRRRVEFSLIAQDETGEIGTGTHSRFVVESQGFLEKAKQR